MQLCILEVLCKTNSPRARPNVEVVQILSETTALILQPSPPSQQNKTSPPPPSPSLSLPLPLPPSPVHVIVATPGRLLDLLEKGIANASQCQMLVLDEADKLLSMDYQRALDKLIAFMPSDRQILLFSATFPNHIKGFTVSSSTSSLSLFLSLPLFLLFSLLSPFLLYTLFHSLTLFIFLCTSLSLFSFSRLSPTIIFASQFPPYLFLISGRHLCAVCYIHSKSLFGLSVT